MSDIKDKSLAKSGERAHRVGERTMPVLRQIRARFEKEQPFKGKTLAAVLHVTAETANLMRTMKAGGANVFLSASNPLSTQDDVAAALVRNTYSDFRDQRREQRDFLQTHRSTHCRKPMLTMDDGADLVSTIHQKHQELLPMMLGGTDETTPA